MPPDSLTLREHGVHALRDGAECGERRRSSGTVMPSTMSAPSASGVLTSAGQPSCRDLEGLAAGRPGRGGCGSRCGRRCGRCPWSQQPARCGRSARRRCRHRTRRRRTSSARPTAAAANQCCSFSCGFSPLELMGCSCRREHHRSGFVPARCGDVGQLGHEANDLRPHEPHEVGDASGHHEDDGDQQDAVERAGQDGAVALREEPEVPRASLAGMKRKPPPDMKSEV